MEQNSMIGVREESRHLMVSFAGTVHQVERQP